MILSSVFSTLFCVLSGMRCGIWVSGLVLDSLNRLLPPMYSRSSGSAKWNSVWLSGDMVPAYLFGGWKLLAGLLLLLGWSVVCVKVLVWEWAVVESSILVIEGEW